MAFRGVDYFAVDSLFSEQELMVRQTARRFADERILPAIRDCFRDARFPKELIPEMAELGFLGASLEGYGCAGMSNVEYGLVMQELERIDSGIRSFVSVQGALVMYPIYAFGSDAQKDRWLPAMQSGKAVGCFGLTEPDFGSNPAGMRTTARRDGDSWVLNGEKTWITNGGISDVAIVWARAEEGVLGFLVETGTPGYTTSDIHGKWSMRASVTSSLAFSDCRVKESSRLPLAKGLKAPLSCLTQARYGIGWGVIGAAMDCYETARAYSVVRKQFDDKPIASHQLVQEKLAWMITEITKAQLLALHAGRLKDQKKLEPAHVSMLKRNNVAIASHQLVQEKLAWMITEITKAQLLALHAGRLKDQKKLEPAHVSMLKRNNVAIALDCARLSRDLLGANGITDEYPIMRHLCNLETVKTYEGTDHIHALVIGERVTGVAAYK